MGVVLFILIVGLLIVAGVFTSVRLYTQGAWELGYGRLKRIRRVRTVRPTPGGPVIEETEEEIIEEPETVVEEPGV
ncbi:MAG TPA: hypothetical protein VNE38_17250 [Ktedonobacteraceae bacterium]|nr:hypothetical protein [Ktedonobacteraceae bacterium]